MERSDSALRVLLFWFDAFRGHHGHHVVFFVLFLVMCLFGCLRWGTVLKKRELPSGLSGVCLPAHQIKKKGPKRE